MRRVLAAVLSSAVAAAPASAAGGLRAAEATAPIPGLAKPMLELTGPQSAAQPASDAGGRTQAGIFLGEIVAAGPGAPAGEHPSAAALGQLAAMPAAAGFEAAFDGSEAARPGSLEAPLPAARAPLLPLRTAWAHAAGEWRNRRALRVPLHAFDHHVLIGYAWTLPSVFFGGGALLASGDLGFAAFASALVGVLFGAVARGQHIDDKRHADRVRRQAKRYAAGAPRQWSEELLGVVSRFEQDTGWRVVWTTGERVLLQADRTLQRVELSVGWALESADPADRGRLAYLFDSLNTRVGQALRLWTKPRGSHAGTLEDPLAEPDLPKLSLRRAWKHRFGEWKGPRALSVPLAASDHDALLALSFILPALGFGGLAASAAVGLHLALAPALALAAAAAIAGAGLIGSVGASGHWKDVADTAAFRRNARRYAEGAPRRWDERALNYIRSFEQRTGWKVVWTDSERLLALADPVEKRVLLPVGWVLESVDPRDRRRLAFLWDTVNVRIGNAIVAQRLDR